MKYIPFVWASIMRKPVRAVLTLLSVMLAFTLFGLTIGMTATFDKMLEDARDDRLFSGARFGGNLPHALIGQISQIPGVALVSSISYLPGYHQDPRNRLGIQMRDAAAAQIAPEWPITPVQWAMLHMERTGLLVSRAAAERWKLRPGDSFTIVAPQYRKADGTTSWTFKVIAITGDLPWMSHGYMFGNYDYYDQARPLAEQGTIDELWIRAFDPAQTTDLVQRLDRTYANSSTPLQSITEKVAFDMSNSGLDIAEVDRAIAIAGMFMVLFLTANGIAQAVRERFSEFATLKAIGFSDAGVIALVFAEAAIPCLLGAGLGLGLAVVISGIMPSLLAAGQDFPIPTMTVMVFVWAGLSAGAVALISTALPAFRLKQMDIATALSGRR